jgi:hypothetical protein
MIIGELAAGVRILLEKGPSRHHISGDQQFQRNTQKFTYYEKTKVARRRGREEQQGGTPPGGAGPPLAMLPCGEATLAHSCHHSLVYIVVPENVSQRVIRLKRIYNFFMLHACSYTICLVFCYTLWRFYAFSGTNLLTRCHSVSSLFSAIFVFQKSYTGNIFGIG